MVSAFMSSCTVECGPAAVTAEHWYLGTVLPFV